MKSEISEDAPQNIANAKMMGNWLNEIYSDYEKTGGFDNLAGKGKPLEVRTEDPLNTILHNANVLPSWLELQHEIRDQIYDFLQRPDNKINPNHEINDINKKIKKYNGMVPSSLLQKSVVSKEFIGDQYKKWI